MLELLLLKRVVAILLGVFVSKIASTQDVNLSMYMYLANHLTPQECSKLVAHLYAGGLGSTAVKELEQELPTDQHCLSLLTTWNNTVGREKSFLTVTNCLRKIGQEHLAEWLSVTVFTQLSLELNDCFLQNTSSRNTVTALPSRPMKIRLKSKKGSCSSSEKTMLFLLFDTLCMYIVLMTITTLVFYSLGLLVSLVKESRKILNKEKTRYTILETGILPQDLESEDEILEPFFE